MVIEIVLGIYIILGCIDSILCNVFSDLDLNFIDRLSTSLTVILLWPYLTGKALIETIQIMKERRKNDDNESIDI